MVLLPERSTSLTVLVSRSPLLFVPGEYTEVYTLSHPVLLSPSTSWFIPGLVLSVGQCNPLNSGQGPSGTFPNQPPYLPGLILKISLTVSRKKLFLYYVRCVRSTYTLKFKRIWCKEFIFLFLLNIKEIVLRRFYNRLVLQLYFNNYSVKCNKIEVNLSNVKIMSHEYSPVSDTPSRPDVSPSIFY